MTTTAAERVERAAPPEPGRPRKEDRRLVQGEGVFVDDVKRHGMGYVEFVRSPHAHARIASVDVSRAAALDGVYGTLVPDEVVRETAPFFELTTPPGNRIRDYALAVGRVRHVGDPVAAVVARTRELARDAAQLVDVEYDPLPALVDARAAQAPDAPLLHEEAGTNVVWSGRFEWGDVDGALAAADLNLRVEELHFHRFASTPIECSGAVVEYDRAAEEYTLRCNHQLPGLAAFWMSGALGIGVDRLRFVTRDVGGGFGNKILTHTTMTALCLLARKLRRPVHWQEWRSDQHTANAHGNERWFRDVEVAVQRDGTLLGFKATMLDDCGAFPRYEPVSLVAWSHVVPGLYRWRHIRLDVEQVVTNKSPVGPNRGFARMQHLWLTERIVDLVAHELGLDPVEVRRRNLVRADEMPYETPNGCIYDSGDYARQLDLALELADYDGWRARQRAGGRKLLGIGIGGVVESGANNFAQSRLLNPELRFSGQSEVATIKLDLFGQIVLTLGTVPQGQGHETVAAQVAAPILGVDPDAIRVRTGHDTHWNSHGGLSGTYASQFAVTGVGAVKGAADRLADELRRLAAAVLGGSADDVVLADGAARLGDEALPFARCGALANLATGELPESVRDVTLNVRHVYLAPLPVPDLERRFGNLALTYSTQFHVAVVEVDPETGVVEVVDHAIADDCGVRINPQIVEGQLHGAAVHGLGAALWESFDYDEDGQLLTPSFYEYHVPHALDVPEIRTAALESPSPVSPLGAKGMGEGGGAAIHAICAAIQDAVARAGGGVVTESHNPPERVWRLLTEPQTSRALVSVRERRA